MSADDNDLDPRIQLSDNSRYLIGNDFPLPYTCETNMNRINRKIQDSISGTLNSMIWNPNVRIQILDELANNSRISFNANCEAAPLFQRRINRELQASDICSIDLTGNEDDASDNTENSVCTAIRHRAIRSSIDVQETVVNDTPIARQAAKRTFPEEISLSAKKSRIDTSAYGTPLLDQSIKVATDIESIDLTANEDCTNGDIFTAIHNENNPTNEYEKLSFYQGKRFRKAICSGLPRIKALSFAKSLKSSRKISNSKTNPPSTTSAAWLNKFVNTRVRLGIVSSDLINRSLSRQQMQIIQDAVIDVSIDLIQSGIKPNFVRSYYQSGGWLLFICANEQTAEWMRQNFDDIRIKCSMNITLLEDFQFPQLHTVRGYLPHSYELSNEKILATIMAQNEYLDTKDWQIIERTREGDGLTLRIIFSINRESMRRLDAIKGIIAYRFGHIKLKQRRSGKNIPLNEKSYSLEKVDEMVGANHTNITERNSSEFPDICSKLSKKRERQLAAEYFRNGRAP